MPKKERPAVEPDYTRQEVAEILGVGLGVVDRLIAERRLLSYKTGSDRRAARRVNRASVEAFRRGDPQEAA